MRLIVYYVNTPTVLIIYSRQQNYSIPSLFGVYFCPPAGYTEKKGTSLWPGRPFDLNFRTSFSLSTPLLEFFFLFFFFCMRFWSDTFFAWHTVRDQFRVILYLGVKRCLQSLEYFPWVWYRSERSLKFTAFEVHVKTNSHFIRLKLERGVFFIFD